MLLGVRISTSPLHTPNDTSPTGLGADYAIRATHAYGEYPTRDPHPSE